MPLGDVRIKNGVRTRILHATRVCLAVNGPQGNNRNSIFILTPGRRTRSITHTH